MPRALYLATFVPLWLPAKSALFPERFGGEGNSKFSFMYTTGNTKGFPLSTNVDMPPVRILQKRQK
jgi:hypothetical protein